MAVKPPKAIPVVLLAS